MTDWIDLKDRMPDLDIEVLCYTLAMSYEVFSRRLPERGEESYFNYPFVWKHDEFFHGAHPEYVTHWQPLPGPTSHKTMKRNTKNGICL